MDKTDKKHKIQIFIDNNCVVASDDLEYINNKLADYAIRIVPLKFEKMIEVAKQYYAILDQGQNANPEEKERIKMQLDELQEPYSDDPAYIALLQMERISKGYGKEKTKVKANG